MPVAASFLALLALFPPAPAAPRAEQPEVPAVETAEEVRARAARLFGEGNALYRQHQYRDAIDKFLMANRLAPEPLVIFAIAQAQRLAGDCQAAQTYASYLLAEPGTSLRETVDTHIAEVSQRCTSKERNDQVAAIIRESAAPPPPSARPWSRTLAWVAGGGAVAVGAAASWAYFSNGLRMTDWEREDKALAAKPKTGASAETWLSRQAANDELAASITRRDQWALGLGLTAGALAVTSLVAYLAGR
jgi:hypothetical protein